jgi:cob(I)alamin adenosyltransferase
MPKLTKIYTRQGDQGQTSLASGERVKKSALRVEVYGTVDELNSILGMAIAGGLVPRLMVVLSGIQNELFHLGTDLSFPIEARGEGGIPQIEPRHIEKMEALIDELNAVVGPLENFILPGGAPGAAMLHLARTVCRRAERQAVALAEEQELGEQVLPYLNRLSDALFVMARYENNQRGVAEPLWDSRA